MYFLGLFQIWHDRGLALIYVTVLGAWCFPIGCGLWWVTGWPTLLGWTVPNFAATLSAFLALVFVFELHQLDSES